MIDYRGDTVITYPSDNLINIRGTIAAVCDHDGNLVRYTNGHAIADSTHQIIEEGSDLNPSFYFNPTYKNYDCHNCHTMLNWGDSLYTLIHIGADGSQGLP